MSAVLPIAEARSRLSEVVKTVRYGRRPVLIGTRGRAEVAVIDIDVYRALQEEIEDALDRIDARAELEAYRRGEGRDLGDVLAEVDTETKDG